MPKLRFSYVFPAKNWHNFVTPFSTFANIKGSLPTKSTTPDRLRCRTKTGSEDFPAGFWPIILFSNINMNIVKKKCFQKVRHLVVIYTPKEAHSRIFVTGGSFFARQMLAKKKAFLGAASLYTVPRYTVVRYTKSTLHTAP